MKLSVSPVTRKIKYRVDLTPAPPGATRVVFLHTILPPLDDEIAVSEIQRENDVYVAEQSRELPATFARGSRLAWTFAIENADLGCEIISGWTRQKIK